MFRQLRFLFQLTHAHTIARRYFVTNGFDGSLTMLGLTMGFYSSGGVATAVIISACLGATIALTVSGLASAYVSKLAEREKELEQAVVGDLENTAHGRAARWVPVLIAVVNGFSPLLMALLIMTPLWLSEAGIALPLTALECAIVTAFLTLSYAGGASRQGQWAVLVVEWPAHLYQRMHRLPASNVGHSENCSL